ncbi:MAG: hypothetical protein KGZ69_18110 [Methylomonas sp.]|nr:hypothetical protein [Methylomonas sp.]
MATLEFTDREMTYLLVALRKYEEILLALEDDEAGDSVSDLLIVQALRKKFKAAKDGTDA